MSILTIPEYSVHKSGLVSGNSACGGSDYHTRQVTKSRIRSVNTNYASIKASGGSLPPLPYYLNRDEATYYIGRAANDSDRYYHPVPCGISHHQYLPGSSDYTELYNDCLDQLYEHIKSGDNFDLGVALAEFPKSVALIADTAHRIGDSIRFLRRGRISSAFNALGLRDKTILRSQRYRNVGDHKKDLTRRKPTRSKNLSKFAANSWLELQYGWKPLLGEAYNGAQAAGSKLQQSGDDLVVSARRSRDFGGASSYTNIYQYITKTASGNHSLSYSMSLSMQVVSPKLRALSALGLTNPLNILWEVTPFSFVVDWFYPVQDYLVALDSLTGYSPGSVSIFRKENRKTVRTVSSTNKRFTSYGMTRDEVIAERTISSLPSPPPPELKLSDRLGGNRLANAIALLRSNFR